MPGLTFSGAALRAARNRAHLTASQLAQRADSTEGSIYRYEYGDMTPRADVLARLAEALDVPLTDLFSAPVGVR